MIFDGVIDAHVHLWNKDREDDVLVLQTKPHLGPLADKVLLTDFLAGEKVFGRYSGSIRSKPWAFRLAEADCT